MPDHFIVCGAANTGFPPEAAATPDHGKVMPRPGPRRARGTAFTLVEMLVVLTIIIILISLVVPATTTLLRGLQIEQSGQLLEGQLDLARQTALSNNRSVEVRICQVNGRFSAIMPLLITAAVNATSPNLPVYQVIGKPTFVSDAVMIDSSKILSTLVNHSGTTAAAPVANYSNPPLGAFGQNYTYVSFKFKPDGSTDLDQSASAPWFLTVHSVNDPDPSTSLPKNFYTIQVDAYNGHVLQFKP